MPQTLLEELKETGKTKGCLLMNSGAECYKQHPQISDLIEYEYKTFLELFAELIASAKASGDISDTTPDPALASIYSSLLNGLIAVIQAGASEQQIEAVMGHIEQVLR